MVSSQRGHQNSLEAIPIHMAMSLVCYQAYPSVSGALYFVFIVGRFLYTQGYATGSPKNRMRGVVGYIGTLGLLALCIATAVMYFSMKAPY